jgi:hypothetical protein
MRIISDFHDYYDSVQATGQDQTLVYYRKAEEVETPEYPFPVLGYCESPYEPCGPRVRQHIVGFCGKIYPVITLTQVASDKKAICHNLEEVDHFVEGNLRKKAIEGYRTGLTRRERRWGWAEGNHRV